MMLYLGVFLISFLAFLGATMAADEALIDAAKKEGHVTWYSTLIINQLVRPVATAFENKYGIKVDYVRTNPSELVIRITNEERSGSVMADIADGTSAEPALRREGFLAQWLPAAVERFPAQYYDINHYWAATNLNVLTPAFNTDLVPRGSEPKTYEDLLDPKWKGRMAWSSSPGMSASAGFIGTVLMSMGEDKGMAYLRELAKQNIAGLAVAARQVLDQVIAGEYAVALQIFNNHAVISASRGAPSAWIAMQPSTANFSVVSLIKKARHPNAAKLLFDFLVSKEGQTLFREADYSPVDPSVPPREPSLRPDGEKFRAIFMTPERIDTSLSNWTKVYNDLFR
jgi:iron(III) transport system substrate-binding protein